ncbi:MAG: heme-dependent oxidative N-demethylase subunit alpha family protein [Gemmatimonadota bacterium]
MAAAAVAFVRRQLVEEYPEHFRWEAAGSGGGLLSCALTGERLLLDGKERLAAVEAPREAVSPPYASALDALASQVQEDLNIVFRQADGSDWLAAAHACAPNYWSPEEKVGLDFAGVHAPVAGIEPITAQAPRWVRAMVLKGPFVRFAWGIGADTRLNHHPVPPPGVAPEAWRGRGFDAARPRLFLRVERQVLWGLPEVSAALFVIRTSFRDGEVLRRDPELAAKLAAAIESMSAASRQYKGLTGSAEAIVTWLRGA